MKVRKLVTETGVIVCQYTERRRQYDRLLHQQLNFLSSLIRRILSKPRSKRK